MAKQISLPNSQELPNPPSVMWKRLPGRTSGGIQHRMPTTKDSFQFPQSYMDTKTDTETPKFFSCHPLSVFKLLLIREDELTKAIVKLASFAMFVGMTSCKSVNNHLIRIQQTEYKSTQV